MGICRALAGYDEEQADYVRKILGKKKVAEAEKEGRKFIPACVERGLSQESGREHLESDVRVLPVLLQQGARLWLWISPTGAPG